jgi:ankyrin repeat protein
VASEEAVLACWEARGEEPFDVAVFEHLAGTGKIVNYQTAAGGWSALMVVAGSGAHGAGDVARLLAVGAEPGLVDADGWTALHLACFFGQFDCVEALLELGASVKLRSANTMGNAPLHAAAAGRHREICALLLSHNAEVNAEQAGLYTPLHAAAASGDEDLVRLLLAHEANTKAKSEKGETALDMARARNHAGVVALLERIGQ